MDDIEQYRQYLRRVVNLHGLHTESSKIKSVVTDKKRKQAGLISAEKINFADGATFDFGETVEIVEGEVIRKKYVYRYLNKDGEFRYDKDSKVIRKDHPECHLHVSGHDNIRFKTRDISFEEVFILIMACYYQVEVNIS